MTTQAPLSAPARGSGDPARDVPPPWSMRQVQPADDTFLDELYVETRFDEVRAWGFPLEVVRSFLQTQAQVQRRAYALQFPDAATSILLQADQADRSVGRLVVASDLADLRALRIVDISVLAGVRGRGLGTWAVSQLLARAAALGAPVRLRAVARGRARPLYHRLGFRDAAPVGQDGYVAMEWRAA